MKIQAIHTPIFRLNGNLENFILAAVGSDLIPERSILCVTSKIVSLAEGRVSPIAEVDKRTLIQREADEYLGETIHGVHLTLTHGQLIPSAGIDASNAEGEYWILYPKDPSRSAERLWRTLKTALRLREFGIILTDSRSQLLRRGVMGVALATWGFRTVSDRRGCPDLFNRPLKITQVNVADPLAAGAVLKMGEGNESQPLSLITEAPVHFHDQAEPSRDLVIPREDDLYWTFFNRRTQGVISSAAHDRK